MSTVKLYDNLISGHAHRPRALLKLLGVDYETITIDFAKGEHKSPNFLALNPLGQLPVLVDGDIVLSDSTAILVYLALTYDKSGTWLPNSSAQMAQIQSWLALSVKEVFEGPCVARLIKLFKAPYNYEQAIEKTTNLLTQLLEPHLSDNTWLVGDKTTIADIANYGYIAALSEGGFDLSQYPHTQAWIKRLESVSGFEKIPTAADVLK